MKKYFLFDFSHTIIIDAIDAIPCRICIAPSYFIHLDTKKCQLQMGLNQIVFTIFPKKSDRTFVTTWYHMKLSLTEFPFFGLWSYCFDNNKDNVDASIQWLKDYIGKHERGRISSIRNNTDKTMDYRKTITRKQK